ncbi:unnamed protein product [Closterium sp. Naga37s-1]|nr:unnamed protein product [Closterium sp. Naga37s-1]
MRVLESCAGVAPPARFVSEAPQLPVVPARRYSLGGQPSLFVATRRVQLCAFATSAGHVPRGSVSLQPLLKNRGSRRVFVRRVAARSNGVIVAASAAAGGGADGRGETTGDAGDSGGDAAGMEGAETGDARRIAEEGGERMAGDGGEMRVGGEGADVTEEAGEDISGGFFGGGFGMHLPWDAPPGTGDPSTPSPFQFPSPFPPQASSEFLDQLPAQDRALLFPSSPSPPSSSASSSSSLFSASFSSPFASYNQSYYQDDDSAEPLPDLVARLGLDHPSHEHASDPELEHILSTLCLMVEDQSCWPSLIDHQAVPRMAAFLAAIDAGNGTAPRHSLRRLRSSLLSLAPDPFFRSCLLENDLCLVPLVGADVYRSLASEGETVKVTRVPPSLPPRLAATAGEVLKGAPVESTFGAGKLLLGLALGGNGGGSGEGGEGKRGGVGLGEGELDEEAIRELEGRTRQQFLARIGLLEKEKKKNAEEKDKDEKEKDGRENAKAEREKEEEEKREEQAEEEPAWSSKSYTLMSRWDGVARLVLLMTLENEQVAARALAAAAELARAGEGNRRALRDAGAVVHAVRWMGAGGAAVRAAAVATVERLSVSASVRLSIIRSGGVGALVALLAAQGDDRDVRDKVVSALLCMVSDEEAAAKMASAIPSFITLLREEDAQTSGEGVKAGEAATVATPPPPPPPQTAAAAAASDPAARADGRAAAESLLLQISSLVGTPCESIVAAGGVPPLVALLATGSLRERAIAAEILGNVIADRPAQGWGGAAAAADADVDDGAGAAGSGGGGGGEAHVVALMAAGVVAALESVLLLAEPKGVWGGSVDPDPIRALSSASASSPLSAEAEADLWAAQAAAALLARRLASTAGGSARAVLADSRLVDCLKTVLQSSAPLQVKDKVSEALLVITDVAADAEVAVTTFDLIPHLVEDLGGGGEGGGQGEGGGGAWGGEEEEGEVGEEVWSGMEIHPTLLPLPGGALSPPPPPPLLRSSALLPQAERRERAAVRLLDLALTGNPGYLQAMARAGAIFPLVEILRQKPSVSNSSSSSSSRGDRMGRPSVACQRAALGVLYALGSNEENHAVMVGAGIEEVLEGIVRRGEEGGRFGDGRWMLALYLLQGLRV